MNAPAASRHVVLCHAPNSRSIGTLVLLDELNADYELRVVDIRGGESHGPGYRRINPMGKVPALIHEDVVITEQAAIFMYLADLYGEVALAPPVGDPLRGPYLRWMVFYGSCFEPALVDRFMQRTPAPPSTCPYGDFDTMYSTLTGALERGPFLLGEQFTAVDALWGMGLKWATQFKLVPESPVVRAYVGRFDIRPSVARARLRDDELLARQARPPASASA